MIKSFNQSSRLEYFVECAKAFLAAARLKPHKAYYAFVALNELRTLGSAVRCMLSDDDVFVAAADRYSLGTAPKNCVQRLHFSLYYFKLS